MDTIDHSSIVVFYSSNYRSEICVFVMFLPDVISGRLRIVEQVIRIKFAEITAASESEILANQHKREIELARIRLEAAKAQVKEKENDLEDYKAETLKVIRGKSKLSIELLNSLVAETEAQIKAANEKLQEAEGEYEELCESAENLRKEYDQLLTWADLYDKSTFEAKKMIVAQSVKAVRVGRDYNIEIDFNVSFEEFQAYNVQNSKIIKYNRRVRIQHKKVRENTTLKPNGSPAKRVPSGEAEQRHEREMALFGYKKVPSQAI